MPTCWARCLGNCDHRQSREHYVSKGLWANDTVNVTGFDWCADAPKSIPIKKLVRKILCKKHNEQLSCVDDAGNTVFGTIAKIVELDNAQREIAVRSRNPPIWCIQEYRVDGRLLERWFLKTLINFCFDQGLKIGSAARTPGWPCDDLVRAAYGLGALVKPAGLYSLASLGQAIYSSDHFSFSPVIVRGNAYISAGIFAFRGLPFALHLDPNDDQELITRSSYFPTGAKLCYHMRVANWKRGRHVSQRLKFKWT